MINEVMVEKARDLGRSIGQTDEYKALERARERFSNDREAVEQVNKLSQLEAEISRLMQQEQEPSEAQRNEYEGAFAKLQGNAAYQGMIAAQSNFDRVLQKVNEEISKGVEAGAKSRIILPS